MRITYAQPYEHMGEYLEKALNAIGSPSAAILFLVIASGWLYSYSAENCYGCGPSPIHTEDALLLQWVIIIVSIGWFMAGKKKRDEQ